MYPDYLGQINHLTYSSKVCLVMINVEILNLTAILSPILVTANMN